MTKAVSANNQHHLEPPQSIPAEQAVLGSILKDANALDKIIDVLPSQDFFYVPKHKVIYRAILDLWRMNEPTDVVTICNVLEAVRELETCGGRSYLIELIDGVASSANVRSYADIIAEKYTYRQLISICNDTVGDSYEQQNNPNELMNNIQAKLFAVAGKRFRKGIVPIADVLPEAFVQLERCHQRPGISGLTTGFSLIDHITAGLHPAEMVVVAGRPSMGKTAFAMNVAEHVALDEKKPVGIFSLEMSREQLGIRLMCGRAKVDNHAARSGKLKGLEWERMTRASAEITPAKIFIDDSSRMDTMELMVKARRMKAEKGVELIIIDYLQLLDGPKRIENRQQEVTAICKTIKAIAKDLNIPVIVVSQLSRATEMRGNDKRPILSDLRESGSIEQDADTVLFVYREEYYVRHLARDDPKRLEAQGKADIIIAKQRNGPIGTAELAFINEYVRFENLYTRTSKAEKEDEQEAIPF